MVTHLLKLGVIINNRSHWVLATEDPCTIYPPCSNDDFDVPDQSSGPSAVNRAALDYVLFTDLVQKIQITQFHDTEICRTVNG
jgi:hypothetical protein